MMLFVVVIVSLAILVICNALYGSYCNPVSFYVIPWGGSTVLALSGLYGIYSPGDTTVTMILAAMIAYSVGCVFMHAVWQSHSIERIGRRATSINKSKRYNLAFNLQLSARASGLLYCLGILAIIYELFLASRTIPLLISGQSLSYIKYQYSNVAGTTLFSTHELLLFSWVAQPILIAEMIYFACELCSHRTNWKTLVLSTVGCLLYITISGGRNLPFIFICILFIALILSSQLGGVLRWVRALSRPVKVIGGALIVAMIVVTEQRSLGQDASVLENVFFYFAGGIAYLDQILSNPGMFDLFNGQYLLGWATFGFIVNPVLIVASIVFRFDYIGSDSIISDAANVYLPFNDSLKGNALCTSLYAFLRDYGMSGSIVGPFLFGSMVGFVWEKSFGEGQSNSKWLPVCVYLMYCVLFSSWRYILVFPGASVLFVVIGVVNIMNGQHLRPAGAASAKSMLSPSARYGRIS